MVKKREEEGVPQNISRFGNFLINRGVVTEAAVLDALDFQKKEIVLIGKIAISQKKLNIKQVLQILNHKINSPKKFGETAIDLGLLKSKEVEELLKIQEKLTRPLGQLLVQLKEIDQNKLKEELTEYARLKVQKKLR